MQVPNTTSASAVRSANGYAPEMASGAVTAVQEPKAASPDSTTVRLSDEAMDRYATDQDKSGNPVSQTAAEASKKSGGSDGIAEALEKLQKMLKEALERLQVAQQEMAKATAEMRNTEGEAQKMAAMMKVQSAQMMVISAQGEVLQIYSQINALLEKQAKG